MAGERSIWVPVLEDSRLLESRKARGCPDDIYGLCRRPVSVNGKVIGSAIMLVRLTDRHGLGQRGLVWTIHQGMQARASLANIASALETKPSTISPLLASRRGKEAPVPRLVLRKLKKADLDPNCLDYLIERRTVRERDATAPVI